MKRILMAAILVVVMLLGCVAPVGAAPSMSLTEYLTACEMLIRDIVVPVRIEGKLESGASYGNVVTGRVGDAAVFRAVLDMTDVKYVVNRVMTEGETVLSLDDFNELKDMPVTGSFTMAATWTGVDAPADITDGNLAGFTFDDVTGSDIFEEDAVRDPGAITIDVKSGKVASDLLSLPAEIILEIDGFSIVSDGQMNGSITGDTTIGVGETGYHDVAISYAFTDPIAPVNIYVRSSSSGGVSTSKFYTLKYETNGGSAYADESYVSGKKVSLTKVPEKAGYVFDGWYADAELTEKITSVTISGDVTVYAGWKSAEGETPAIVHPVPEMLNGAEHFMYLAGYPDGTIKPSNNITRAEVATVFFRLLKDEIRDNNITTENVFDDVNKGDWYNTAISTLAKLGVVNGRTADTFAPDEYITRAEFTAICARFDDANEEAENKFTDISEHWAKDYILEASAYGWITGYEDDSFRPERKISRAEAATLINRVLNRVPASADVLLEGMKEWPDNIDSEWYYLAIQEATNSHTFEMVNEINEKWVELAANRDWTVYEK